jgi:acyl-CoA reductase-like NAD-dependent aldehyde dehydrogenase
MTTTTAEARQTEYKMLIGGELVPSSSGGWLDSVDPATEEIIGRVPAGSRADIDRGVEAAVAAFGMWAGLDSARRAAYLRGLAARLRSQKNAVVQLEVADTGNTIREMELDVDHGADALEYYAGLALEAKGDTIPATAGNLHFTIREPFGVVGRIIPFNHPIMFAASKLAAPLAAGNCVVLKPSEQSPLSSLLFAEMCQEILPAGVVNIVSGLGATAGDALVRHPGVKRVAFTGSVATGMAIQRAVGEAAVKQLSLELGGKNPMIVFPDADVPRALQGAIRGMNFSWQGQSCGSTSRLFLHASLYDDALAELTAMVRRLRIGDPRRRSSDVGPVNSAGQLEKDLRYIDIARSEGARLVAGGERPKGEEFGRGYWLEPTVFADVTPAMRIFQEEVFGPVLSVIRFTGTDEVIEMANAVEYGLTAAIWTRDIRAALAAMRRVQAGYVWINGSSAHYPASPFGGKKNSGVGSEEGLGELLSYTENKTVHVIL